MAMEELIELEADKDRNPSDEGILDEDILEIVI